MLIHAANVEDLHVKQEWIVVDLGFSSRSKSCGILIDETVQLLTFAKLKGKLEQVCGRDDARPIYLILEAPLSASFDHHGNPVGRIFEKRNSATRYWYSGLGCSVLTSATYLMRHLHNMKIEREIRLVEGFASFKEGKSDHKMDVEMLRKAAQPHARNRKIHAPGDLVANRTNSIVSAFAVSGMDFGVPPVVELK